MFTQFVEEPWIMVNKLLHKLTPSSIKDGVCNQ